MAIHLNFLITNSLIIEDELIKIFKKTNKFIKYKYLKYALYA